MTPTPTPYFDIHFLTDETPPEEVGGRFGRIVIGDFRERFLVSTAFWAPERYERQWVEAATQVLGGTRAGLLTSMPDPATDDVVRLWTMYPDGEWVRFQEQMVFLGEIADRFDPTQTGRFVHEREIVSEDGHPISEWSEKAIALQGFVNRKTAPEGR
jgi:hypothetical protein